MAQNSPQSGRFAASVFERHQAGLMRFIVRRLCPAQDSGDLAQEVYLRLLRLEGSEFIRKPQAYVYAIASHVISQFRLRADHERVSFDSEALEELAGHADLPADELADRLDAERRVKRMLDALPEMHRAVLVLRKRDGLSHPEIARELGISPHTVKRYLHEAQVRIRAMDWRD